MSVPRTGISMFQLNLDKKYTLSSAIGPWFLGFAFESFAMGIVVVLASSYFLAVTRTKRQRESIALSSATPSSSSSSSSSLIFGLSLVFLSLLTGTAQWVIDLVRGARIFGSDFGNIEAFITPDLLFFISPLLGIISAAITQGFLAHRIIRFLQSLDMLWPALAHSIFRYFLATIMGLVIMTSAGFGACASWLLYESGSLVNLIVTNENSKSFHNWELWWLSSSLGIDIFLSVFLCAELYWARRKLSIQGGRMRHLVDCLILVTLHGGVSVSAIQLSSMLLYQNNNGGSSFCYMLILPAAHTPGLSLAFSLPTIHDHDPQNQPIHNRSQTSLSPRYSEERRQQPTNREIKRTNPQRRKKRGVKEELKKSLLPIFNHGRFRSEKIVPWSLVGDSRRGIVEEIKRPDTVKIRGKMQPQESVISVVGSLEPRNNWVERLDERRPSESNSLSPLLRMRERSMINAPSDTPDIGPYPQSLIGTGSLRGSLFDNSPFQPRSRSGVDHTRQSGFADVGSGDGGAGGFSSEDRSRKGGSSGARLGSQDRVSMGRVGDGLTRLGEGEKGVEGGERRDKDEDVRKGENEAKHDKEDQDDTEDTGISRPSRTVRLLSFQDMIGRPE